MALRHGLRKMDNLDVDIWSAFPILFWRNYLGAFDFWMVQPEDEKSCRNERQRLLEHRGLRFRREKLLNFYWSGTVQQLEDVVG